MPLTPEQLERRRRVMARSMALGHCICDVRQGCPCEEFRLHGVCHCAGETPPQPDGPIRLTQHVRNPGCASKVPKRVLQDVLRGLPTVDDPRVLVGAAAGDDAGVILLSADAASILTVDVFAPSVDDPYTFGQIAAANSLSDIYAMGGTPQAALSIVGYPTSSLDPQGMHDMLRGGADKMKEAGVAVIGGHSMQDDQIFCGFAVLGTAAPSAIVRNAGAKVGDAIVLTKPLGSGIVLFAGQLQRASAESIAAVTTAAASLNRAAGAALKTFGATAATDVTGFSLLGHAVEIVANSNVVAQIDFPAIPVFAGVVGLAQQGVIPGAVERNRESVDPARVDASAIADFQQSILYCPETSGGILAFVPQERAAAFVDALASSGNSAAIIGKVVAEHPGGLIRVTAGPAARLRVSEPLPQQGNQMTPTHSSHASCCGDGQNHELAMAASVSSDGRLPAPAAAEAFHAYMGAVTAPGALPAKHKKLMALALSITQQCESCVKKNAHAARAAGATDDEIAETAALAIAFGGAPCAMFYSNVRSGGPA